MSVAFDEVTTAASHHNSLRASPPFLGEAGLTPTARLLRNNRAYGAANNSVTQAMRLTTATVLMKERKFPVMNAWLNGGMAAIVPSTENT